MAAIKVSTSTLEKVKKIGKSQGIKNNEFVDLAADFFIKTNLDLDGDYSIKSEITANNKRLNQVIAFIRKQETEHLIPIFRELNITNNKINKHLNTYSPQKIENTFNELTNSLRSLKESNQLINKEKEHYQLTIEKMQLQLERADRRNTLIMELMSIKGGWGTKDSTRLKAIEQELIQYAR